MKIALVIERFEPWRGGAETSAQQFAERLVQAGVEVTVIANVANFQPGQPIRIIKTEYNLYNRYLNLRSFVRAADRILEREEFDLVHSLTPCRSADIYQPRGGVIAETIARNVSIRGTWSARTVKRVLMRTNPKSRFILRLERYLAEKKDCLFVGVSDYVCRQVHRHYQVSPERVVKVFNGVELSKLSSFSAENIRRTREIYRLAQDDVVGLFVAHNFKLKGLDTTLKALQRLGQGAHGVNLKILIVGGARPKRYIQLAEKLGVGRQVIFLGPTQRIGEFYRLADFCVHPTYYDPCSRVVLEALACGLPCITTRFNGASEIMENGREGFIMAASEPASAAEELAAALAKMCDGGLRKRMSAAAVQLRQRVSMERHVNEMLAVYETVRMRKNT